MHSYLLPVSSSLLLTPADHHGLLLRVCSSCGQVAGAGFFLFAVQPFRTGDRIAVRSQASGEHSVSPAPTPGWFEGTCEAVDLRQARTLSILSGAANTLSTPFLACFSTTSNLCILLPARPMRKDMTATNCVGPWC